MKDGTTVLIRRSRQKDVGIPVRNRKWQWVRDLVLDELIPGELPTSLEFEEYRAGASAGGCALSVNRAVTLRSFARRLPPNHLLKTTLRKAKDGGAILWLWVEECEPRW